MAEPPPLTTEHALKQALRCVESHRPLGWAALRVLLLERDELLRRLAASQEEVAGLTHELARKRGRGTAGEPRQ